VTDKTIYVLLLSAACPFDFDCALGREPTGDVASMKRVEALQREALALYPNGRIRATVKSKGFLGTRGPMEADVVAVWNENASRTDAEIFEEWIYPAGVRQTDRWKVTDVNVGTEHSHYDGLRRNVHVFDWHRENGIDYVACIPRHCWFGGDEASGRRWIWFLERCDEKAEVERQTHTETEGSLVRIRQTCRKDGKQVGQLDAEFDLALAGMCVSFKTDSEGRLLNEGTLSWTLDDQGRPLLQSLNWKHTNHGRVRSGELVILEFNPDFLAEEETFSRDLTQYPAGTTIIDQRSRPPRKFLVESGEPLDPSP
jgi:hypothetical protein